MTLEILEPSMLIFVIKRFMRDLRNCLGVTVAWSTHTRYAPLEDDSDPFAIEPIRDPKTQGALIPAICLVGPEIIRNQNSYTAHRPQIETRFVRDGRSVAGMELRNPSWIVQMGFEVQIFHNRKMLLWNLAERFRQYLVQKPYLVIPADRLDTNGDTIADHRQFIRDFWSSSPPENQERDGTVVFQRIPHDAPILSSTSQSNDDNLFVTESAVLLENIPLADESIVAERPFVEEILIDVYDLADPSETPQVSVSVVPDEE